MQKIEIQWMSETHDKINQVYSVGLEFAAANAAKQCSDFVYCKDFLQDTVWAILHNTPVEIYKFKFDPVKNRFDVNDMIRILVANESDQFFHQRIPNCIEFLNKIETVLHLKKTTVCQCNNPPEKYLPSGVFLFEGSQRWMSAPPLLSMYTLLMRCGFVHKIGDDYMITINKIISGETEQYQIYDREYLTSSLPGIRAILELGYRKIFYRDMKKNYPKNVAISTLHHDCGICAYATGNTKKTVPHWHRTKLLEDLSSRGVEINNLWITLPPPAPPKDAFFTKNTWIN